MNKITFVLIVSLLISSCSKNNTQQCPTFWGDTSPTILVFKIINNGQRLSDSTLNGMKLSYIQNGTKNYINISRTGSGSNDTALLNTGYLGTQDIALKNSSNLSKEFYLEYIDGDIDTIFADIKHLTTACEADTTSCQCTYPIQALKFNGQIPTIITYIDIYPVYGFVKH